MVVHRLPHEGDGFQRVQSLSENGMRALRVVIPPPLFDDNLGFSEGMEYLSIQEFVPETGVEALATAGLPRSFMLNISSICADDFVTASAINSGPLPERMQAGSPRVLNRSVRASITSAELRFLFTLVAEHFRLSSSVIWSAL